MTFRPDAVSRGLLVLIFLLLIIITAREFTASEPVVPKDFTQEDQQFQISRSEQSSAAAPFIETDTTDTFKPKSTPDKLIKKSKQTKAESRVININSATAVELTELKGVGDKMAAKIIEYRTINGPFKTPEDLKKVKGIGDKKFESLKAWIKL